nr:MULTISPECIES: GFA family protein [unclassified Halomonas]
MRPIKAQRGSAKEKRLVIRQVGRVKIQPKHRATCHCGIVELELDLPEGLVDPKRCNCSICRRKGAVMAYVPLNGLRILRGAEHLKLYQFNSGDAKHYFCSNCGIYTHHQTRSNPTVYGFNVGCMEGINPFDLDDLPVSDGINHESDQ